MIGGRNLTAAVLTSLTMFVSSAPAQQRGVGSTPAASTLTAQDYAEIQQLSNRYGWAIDACTNGGYDFADLFSLDGEWSLSEQWGVPGNRARTKGRDALASLAGGDGKGGCKDPKTMLGYGISHVIVNHVITPTPEGAVGKSYVLAIGVGGDPTKIERQGGYEDVYVKTPAGWRFKSRAHVFPNIRESVQFGPGSGRGQAAPSQTPNQPVR
jgi:SnoaL-like domain